MKKILSFFAICFLVFLYSCQSCNISHKKGEKIEKDKMTIKEMIVEKIGKNYKLVKNSTQDHAICLAEEELKENNGINKVSFLIINLNNNIILFEDVIANAEVSWENNNLVRIKRIPGMISKNEIDDRRNILYRYDIRKKMKI